MDIRIYRSWMYERFLPNGSYNSEFWPKVKEFIAFAVQQEQYQSDKAIRCPCAKHKNMKFLPPDVVAQHLLKDGFMPNYWHWIAHGEAEGPSRKDQSNDKERHNEHERMVIDVVGQCTHGFESGSNEEERVDVDRNCEADFYNMLHSAQRPLYDGCTKYSELSMATELMSIKSDYNLSQKCIDRVLALLKNSNPEGPYSPKDRIDVYLKPLIDELKLLWHEGVETFDISMKQNFKMRASLMWTINDFPALGMLSGWSTHERLACPICMDNTKAFRLKNGSKPSWFDCHRQFLPMDHIYRKNKDAFFKNRVEDTEPPLRLSGDELLEQVSELEKITEMPVDHEEFSRFGKTHNWKKRSIFWDLPYWKTNLIRHNLDVMHTEKNVFDNIFNTIMDNKEKTKDNAKAREDLKLYCKRPELELKHMANNKTLKPKAKFTLSLEQRREVCTWLITTKFWTKNLKIFKIFKSRNLFPF